MKTYTAPTLPVKLAKAVQQGAFDFACPFRGIGPAQWLTPQQASATFGYDVDFVYSEIQAGRLETIAPLDRDVQRHRITKRSVLVLLAAMIQVDPEEHLRRIMALIEMQTRREWLDQIVVSATVRRAQL